MTNNLMIASTCQNKAASWKLELDGFVSTTLIADSMGALRAEVEQIKPEVVLLDYGLLGADDVVSLSRISTQTRIVIIGGDISEEMEWKLLKAGVRGCYRNDADTKFLKQVVMAVRDGELWIRRTLTCRLIDELGRTTAKNKAYRVSLGLLNKLTQREYDIAVRVGNGESNKLIAKACGITERTVKAHLTEVFQKLGVTDRLNLALVLSADERASLRKSPSSPVIGKLEMNRSLISSHTSL
ncbi:MAG: response regulator transcription factor [Nitrosomonadales bacterium]|nr:response regulator transcription factor [Nitrosomonadales bacterium]